MRIVNVAGPPFIFTTGSAFCYQLSTGALACSIMLTSMRANAHFNGILEGRINGNVVDNTLLAFRWC